ncbi:FAD-dependent oxidoreductase [uncultured Nitrosomonas sp.]|uniref:FAD-dependent oxidoreductase n=1 Tax=uncultured Nitrosomonas sp. TaxID=156424 RepID=UPI0025CC32D7|nr:FAD-dependent oxidoreductase [uncultured Nitrosomonas sp.]
MIGLTQSNKDLLLIGGGHSHIIAIKRLAVKPLTDTRITLISSDTLTPYSGMLPGLIAGHHTHEDCHIDLRKLCQWVGIKFIHCKVTHMDSSKKQIDCQDNLSLRYDVLSINVGSQPALHSIPGAIIYGSPVKPIKQFLQQWQHWLTTQQRSSHLQRIVVVGGGAAGIEILLALHYRLANTTSIRAEFTLICADSHILNSHNKKVQNFFHRHLQTLGIQLIQGKYVVSALEHQLVLNDHTRYDYDFLAWAIHANAQPWLGRSGLACDDNGFIQVDKYLRSISHPDIFATGDCAAFTPMPLPKAGVYAVRQGPFLAKNISTQLVGHGSLQPYKPQRYFLSLLTTGGRHAVASRGAFFAHGKWVWLWKNYIDRSFITSFNLK